MAELNKAKAMSYVGCKVAYLPDKFAETTKELLVLCYDAVAMVNMVKQLGVPVQHYDVVRLLKENPSAHIEKCAPDDQLFLEYTEETANEKKSRNAAVEADQKIKRGAEPEEEIEDVGPPERKRVRRDVSINININGATPTDEYLQCPISHEIMTDPVVASDGHTYERNNIKEWLRRDRVSPITNLPMDDWLTPNYAIKSIIANRAV